MIDTAGTNIGMDMNDLVVRVTSWAFENSVRKMDTRIAAVP